MLKKCPFCASLDLDVNPTSRADEIWHYVQCNRCQACGPVEKSLALASYWWNARRSKNKFLYNSEGNE